MALGVPVIPSMDAFLQDLRFSLRMLRRNPVFTAVAVLSLALGIGANTAIFTLLDQVLLRGLPVKNPQELVFLKTHYETFSGSMSGPNTLSYPMYKDFRDKLDVFSGVIARSSSPTSLAYKEKTERGNAELVSGNYFQVLGVQSALGRLLTASDDVKPGAHSVVVLSYAYWRQRFGADPSILNQTIYVNGTPMQVIGVSSPRFYGVEFGSTDVFVPITMTTAMKPPRNDLENRRSVWLNVYARLKPGVSREQAQAAMNVFYYRQLQEEAKALPGRPAKLYDRWLRNYVSVVPGWRGQSDFRDKVSTALIALMAMVGFVLLIACANVANLLVAKAAARQKEFSVRLALGARRIDIVRLLTVESICLSLLGGLAGLLIAYWASDALIHFLPNAPFTQVLKPEPNLRILLFTFAASMATGLMFGLIPAWQAARPKIAETLKGEAGSVMGGVSQNRLRKGLVIAQVALSLLLLIGAGLFTRSLLNLKNVNTGFHPENLVSFSLDPSLNGFNAGQTRQFYEQLLHRMVAIPSVRSASFAKVALMGNDTDMYTMRVEGYTSKEGENITPHINFVGPDFLKTIAAQLVAGRDIHERDTAASPRVAIINESAANYLFKNENPLGRRIGFTKDEGYPIEIVGVVKDMKDENMKQEQAGYVYLPSLQDKNPSRVTFYLRTQTEPDQIMNAIRQEVRSLDANLPIFGVKSVPTQIDELLFKERLIAALSAAFGLLATLLAAVGLYGVTAYSVARRTREIGIRVALGAEKGRLLWMVLKEVLVMTVIGLAIGLPGAYLLGRYIESQLYGLKASDPMVLVGAALLLSLITFLAGLIPAERATRVDPMVALRYE